MTGRSLIKVDLFIQKIIMGEVDPVYQTSLCSSFECVIDLNSLLEIIIYKYPSMRRSEGRRGGEEESQKAEITLTS